jgi:superfamily II DNA helicase RecQ
MLVEYIAFLSCLEFALLNSVYQGIILKPKQVLCLESVYLQNDVMCVLPTGYGKSLIFHLLPMLLFAKFKLRGDLLLGWRLKGITTTVVDAIVIVVSPLNSLMSNQISRLSESGIRASVMNTKETRRRLDSDDDEVDVDIDFSQCEEIKLRDGHYHIVFAHPETLISSKYGRELLLSKHYQENVVAIVVDEAHCIIEW